MTTSIAPPSSRNNAALGIIGGSFVGVMALTAPFVLMHVRSPLPYMATPRRKVERALAFVVSRRPLRAAESRDDARGLLPNRPSSRGGRTNDDRDHGRGGDDLRHYVDLGSGDGTSVLAAASLGWHATGVEMNPTLWLVSRFRRLCLSPPAVRERSEFLLCDMFGSGGVVRGALRNADVVMVFGVAPLMPRIADLVMGGCRPGCLLMSYRFRMPLLTPSSPSSASAVAASAAAIDIGEVGVPTRATTTVVAPGGGGMKDRGPIVDGSFSSYSSSGGYIDATLIYDEEEMRIYELKT
jgi:hypothetical protein